KPDPEAVLIV
nr:RecName: Full=46 kDa cell wall protein [Phaseolus vulgaris]